MYITAHYYIFIINGDCVNVSRKNYFTVKSAFRRALVKIAR